MKLRELLLLAVASALSACGGGGSAGEGNVPARPVATLPAAPVTTPSSAAPATPQPPTTPQPPATSTAPAEPATPVSIPVVEPTTPSVPTPYTLSVKKLVAKYVAGYSASLSLQATATSAISAPVYVSVVADNPVLNAAVSFTRNVDGSYTMATTTSDTIAAGRYLGNLTVNVCNDPGCATQVAGAPFKLPYDIEAVPPAGSITNYDLKPLAPLVGVADWSTLQGNAAHTAYVPASLDAAKFSARWKWEAPAYYDSQYFVRPPATGGGNVYVTTSIDILRPGAMLYALNESDASAGWSRDFSDLSSPGSFFQANTFSPAYADGKVYMTVVTQRSAFMYGFNANSGSQIFREEMGSQNGSYVAPTVFGGTVYANGGQFGGLYAFDGVSGMQTTHFSGVQQIDRWAPALDDNYLYLYLGGYLEMRDRFTGAVIKTIVDHRTTLNSAYLYGATPVIGAPSSIFAINADAYTTPSLSNFDTMAGVVRWNQSGSYAGNPAYHNATVYAINNAPLGLEARAEMNGALLWSWVPPADGGKFVGHVLVTNNLVFCSTETATYAIDLATHALAWSYPASGTLAISANGVLYIQGQSNLTAINLH